ncbi:MAG: Type I restriction modification DNA specificity domain protein [Bacteroidetes bacterium ADurb.Bin217]|nr:MAG: Type I restriction modification DNA specificity domain protein [Bacteroidetes bacterium ADurb.Bin217]
MKNYKRIGDYIQLVDERNKGLQVKQLLGLSISKQFIPSVANIIGTDMENYKIIRKNQFACSTMQVRRDKKMPVALLQDINEAIISQAYPVFEVKDSKELLPEYLMMWFTRSEFDREACFNAVGGVRGSLEWEDFCDMQLPIPSPEKQREIVAEYNVIQNRINLNNQLIAKLEETAQAVYKQWFVDFEFPDENGNPYKSSGGEMVESELGKIPKGWRVAFLDNECDKLYGYPFNSNLFSTISENNIPLIRIRDILNGYSDIYTSEVVDSKYLLENGDLLIGMDGTFHMSIWYSGNAYLNQRVVRFKTISNELSNLQILHSIKQQIIDFENNIQGTTVAHLSDKHIKEIIFLVGVERIQKLSTALFSKLTQNIIIRKQENQKLTELKELLLSRLATVK